MVSPRGRTAAGVAEGRGEPRRRDPAARARGSSTRTTRASRRWPGVAARLARGPRRPPVLATFHGVRHAEYRAAAAVLRLADARRVRVRGPRRRARRRPGFPDAAGGAQRRRRAAARSRRAARLDAELGLGGAPVVLAAGRLVAQKNHARFLDAAALVAAARPDVRFLLVGDGPLRGELEEQARARSATA